MLYFWSYIYFLVYSFCFQSTSIYIIREQNGFFYCSYVVGLAIEFLICAVSLLTFRLTCFDFVVPSLYRVDLNFMWMVFFFLFSLFRIRCCLISSSHAEVYEIVRVTFVCGDVHYISHSFSSKMFDYSCFRYPFFLYWLIWFYNEFFNSDYLEIDHQLWVLWTFDIVQFCSNEWINLNKA